MDTSDSEAFESADEDFDQDERSQSQDTSVSSSSDQVASVVANVNERTTLQCVDSELQCDFNTETQQEFDECHRIVRKNKCEYAEVLQPAALTEETEREHIDICAALAPPELPCVTPPEVDAAACEAAKHIADALDSILNTPYPARIDLLADDLDDAETTPPDNHTDSSKTSTFDDLTELEPPKPPSEPDDADPNPKREEYTIPPAIESCWEDGVEWTPIEEIEKTIKESSKETDGWDEDFDSWDTFDDSEPDNTPRKQDVAPLLEKLSLNPHDEKASGWGGWGSWGVTSLLSTATGSVQTFTNQVSQGLTTVLESGMGVPSPEELARAQKIQREQSPTTETLVHESPPGEPQSGFGLGNLMTGVSHITKLVETTGSRVVSTGLDTLEVIGKKTMEVLQEGDPGLAKKRALLGLQPDKPCLSQILREAKEKAETEDKLGKKQELKKVHFETLFDDYQGLVHLEALEMLSKQCDIKLSTLLETYEGAALDELQETMVQVKELCELPDEDDDEQSDIKELKSKLDAAVEELGIKLTYERLLRVWEDAETAIKDVDDDIEVHKNAIETLAQITSVAVEQFHKCAELLLVKERRSTADEADSLVQLTSTLTALIGVVAAKFSEKLDSLAFLSDNPDLNSLITDVFFEATQSSSYIQDAFQLFVPILQVGAV